MSNAAALQVREAQAGSAKVVPPNTATAPFRSLLSPSGSGKGARHLESQPDYFVDLNLDRVVEQVVAKREESVLRPLLHTRCDEISTIRYRQDVFRDLERTDILQPTTSFVEAMQRFFAAMACAESIRTHRHRQMVLLRARCLYHAAVVTLFDDLEHLELCATGLRGLHGYVATYVRSPEFHRFSDATDEVTAALYELDYGMLFRDDQVRVRRYAGEQDYATQVLQRFARFQNGDAVVETAQRPRFDPALNHVEAAILDHVGTLHPAEFTRLDRYLVAHADFVDPVVASVYHDLGFYLAWLAAIAPLRKRGLNFCYPEITTAKDIHVQDGFDLALAMKLQGRDGTVTPNDFALSGDERILVVTGPNQGGKTTFARMVGQLHHLAALGVPVPGSAARVYLADDIHTHFERSEQIADLHSKLESELVRLKATWDVLTPRSLVILNEVFSSTGLEDQTELSRSILDRLLSRDVLAICVTFIDSLASFDPRVVSMVSLVDPINPARRTFRLDRRPADGLAYAFALAEKHGVTHDRLKERIRP